MAFVSSHISRVSYDNSSASLTDLTAYITNISGVDLTRANLDTTSLNDAAFTYLLGLKGGNTITLSGNWDSTLHTHMTGVEALTSGATQTLRYSPAGTGSPGRPAPAGRLAGGSGSRRPAGSLRRTGRARRDSMGGSTGDSKGMAWTSGSSSLTRRP